MSNRQSTPELSLCLLALPSKAVSSTSRPPTLVLHIPLWGDEEHTTLGWDEASFFAPPAAARIPVRVWWCGNLGVCSYRYNGTLRREAPGTVLLFPTPHATCHREAALPEHSNLVLVHALKDLDLPLQEQIDESSSKGANLLWRVSCVPTYSDALLETNSTDHYLCETVQVGSPAYCLLINNAGGDCRLTWIVENMEWDHQGHTHRLVEPYTNDSRNEALDRDTIQVEPIDDSGWETLICDRLTGELQTYDTTTSDGCGFARSMFSVSFSALFNVSSLLHNILTRRPELVRPHYDLRSPLNFPSLSSHVVGLSETGQCLELLLVFAVGHEENGLGCKGVFVAVDLFTQQYRELEWIRHNENDTPPASCDMLALERRRRQFDSGAAASRYQLTTSARYHDETLAELYPDCQTLDNLAVRKLVPILSLAARSAPVEVAYF